MSKAVYDRILAEFREAWSKAERSLANVDVLLDDSLFDRGRHDVICSVCLPIGPCGERFTVFPRPVVADTRWSSDETRATFKRLCSEAGAALPAAFTAQLSDYVPLLVAEPAAWWIALLLYLTNATASWPDGSHRDEVAIPRPFLVSIEAIQQCGLNTDHPLISEGRENGEAVGSGEAAPPAAKTEQGEGKGGAGSNGGAAGTEDEIIALEQSTPPLDRNSGKWVNNKRAADIEGVGTRTLADYRSLGIKDAAGNLGRDKDGRVWRREGTPKAHPWYLRSTLLAK